MDAIISDCGVATYKIKHWLLTDAEWDTILADAKRINYPYRSIMKSIRDVLNNGSDKRVRFFMLVKVAIDQHRRAYRWLTTKHGRDSWLGVIPADILGIIHYYLRSKIYTRTTTKTCMMGMLHSFDDQPAVQKIRRDTRFLSWYRLGKPHRVAAPSYIESSAGKYIFCHWLEHGRDLTDQAGFDSFTIEGNRITHCGFHNFRPLSIVENPDEHAAARAICRRDLDLDILE